MDWWSVWGAPRPYLQSAIDFIPFKQTDELMENHNDISSYAMWRMWHNPSCNHGNVHKQSVQDTIYLIFYLQHWWKTLTFFLPNVFFCICADWMSHCQNHSDWSPVHTEPPSCCLFLDIANWPFMLILHLPAETCFTPQSYFQQRDSEWVCSWLTSHRSALSAIVCRDFSWSLCWRTLFFYEGVVIPLACVNHSDNTGSLLFRETHNAACGAYGKTWVQQSFYGGMWPLYPILTFPVGSHPSGEGSSVSLAHAAAIKCGHSSLSFRVLKTDDRSRSYNSK